MAVVRSCYRDVLPFTAMVTVEITNVGSNILFKSATSKGLLSYYVFIVYSYAFATVLLLLPFPFIFSSRTRLPPMTFSVLYKTFLLGLIGFMANLCAYKGIDYSSPTLASAMSNLTPALTFLLAVIFRMEKLSLRSINTRAKLIGTLVSMSGALVVILFKGPTVLSAAEIDWLKGGVSLFFGYLLFSSWHILQTHIMKIYPAEIVLALLYNLFGTIISAPICLLVSETKSSDWSLRPGIALTAIIYSGFFSTAFSTILVTWTLNLKGPVYVSIFKPLSIGIAAVSSFIFLGDDLFLGSVVGALMISVGFYGVIWGQAKEEEMRDQELDLDNLRGSHSGNAPLLESYKVESIQHHV